MSPVVKDRASEVRVGEVRIGIGEVHLGEVRAEEGRADEDRTPEAKSFAVVCDVPSPDDREGSLHVGPSCPPRHRSGAGLG
jgi:hypothetical protein